MRLAADMVTAGSVVAMPAAVVRVAVVMAGDGGIGRWRRVEVTGKVALAVDVWVASVAEVMAAMLVTAADTKEV